MPKYLLTYHSLEDSRWHEVVVEAPNQQDVHIAVTADSAIDRCTIKPITEEQARALLASHNPVVSPHTI